MLSLRKRLLIIIGSVLFIILAILLWVFFRNKSTPFNQTEPTEQGQEQLPPIGEVDFKQPDNIPPEQTQSPVNPDEVYAKQSARIFVERFWSYSNQNDNQHIDDALVLATESMRDWVLSQSRDQSIVYQGLTTEVLSSRIIAYSAERTSVEVEARQTARTTGDDGKIVEEIKNITAKVDLVKVDGTWLVEGLWENK